MAAGTAIGEYLDLEQRMENLGDWVKSNCRWFFLFLISQKPLSSASLVFSYGCHGQASWILLRRNPNHVTPCSLQSSNGQRAFNIVFTTATSLGTDAAFFHVSCRYFTPGKYCTLLTRSGKRTSYLTDLMIQALLFLRGSILIFALGFKI